MRLTEVGPRVRICLTMWSSVVVLDGRDSCVCKAKCMDSSSDLVMIKFETIVSVILYDLFML